MADLQRLCDNKVSFLGGRMFESYLLNAAAITAVANAIDRFTESGVAIDQTDVAAWLSRAQGETKYGRPTKDGQAWNEYGDAAKLLYDLFSHFSGTQVEYSKTTHSVLITDWLVDNSPGDLQEIADLLAGILDSPLIAAKEG